jgi:hypothetical protein
MNRPADVAAIQMLLNAYLESSAQPNRLNVNGNIDAATIDTRAAQSRWRTISHV